MKWLAILTRKILALLVGILAGATLSFFLLGGGPAELIRLPTGNAYIITVIQWNITIATAAAVGVTACLIWCVLMWRRLDGIPAAITLGFILTTAAAAMWLWDAVESWLGKWVIFASFGAVGSICGLITLGTDSGLRILMSRLTNLTRA